MIHHHHTGEPGTQMQTAWIRPRDSAKVDGNFWQAYGGHFSRVPKESDAANLLIELGWQPTSRDLQARLTIATAHSKYSNQLVELRELPPLFEVLESKDEFRRRFPAYVLKRIQISDDEWRSGYLNVFYRTEGAARVEAATALVEKGDLEQIPGSLRLQILKEALSGRPQTLTVDDMENCSWDHSYMAMAPGSKEEPNPAYLTLQSEISDLESRLAAQNLPLIRCAPQFEHRRCTASVDLFLHSANSFSQHTNWTGVIVPPSIR